MSDERSRSGVRAVGFCAADTTARNVVGDTFQIEWDDAEYMVTAAYLEDAEAFADRYTGVSVYGYWPPTEALPLDASTAEDIAARNREAYETVTTEPRAVEFWAADDKAAEYVEETFLTEWADGDEFGVVLSLDDAVDATSHVADLHIAQHHSPLEPLPYDAGQFPMDAATAEQRAAANRHASQEN